MIMFPKVLWDRDGVRWSVEQAESPHDGLYTVVCLEKPLTYAQIAGRGYHVENYGGASQIATCKRCNTILGGNRNRLDLYEVVYLHERRGCTPHEPRPKV